MALNATPGFKAGDPVCWDGRNWTIRSLYPGPEYKGGFFDRAIIVRDDSISVHVGVHELAINYSSAQKQAAPS